MLGLLKQSSRYYLAPVNLVLFCTPRMILSSEGAWTTPAQFSRQCAAVRKMLLPIWEKRENQKNNRCLYRPVLLRSDCTSPSPPPPSAKDPSKGDPWPVRRLSDEKFYFELKSPRPQHLQLSWILISPHIDNLRCTRQQRWATL